jgi:imidazolonepropionase-like amidohydrolase
MSATVGQHTANVRMTLRATRQDQPMSAALHVRGVVLPDDEQRELWIVDGRVTTEPIADAQTVGEGWVVPGLVDAHCHIGVDANGPVDTEVQEQQARTERDAGVLLARDCGVPSDTRWIDDRADLPRIVRAGQHIARSKRYIRNYGVEVEPADLVQTVAAQARRGDGWVKIVGDWIDRDLGDLGPCWPDDVLAEAVARAHELGARVTTHVFGEAALPGLLAAGVDCVEHGTGLADDQIAAMAEAGTALVPTLVNIETFPNIAAQASRFPAYADHMLALHERVDRMVATAYDAGVPIYAGTDAGGSLRHGLIAHEVQALHRAGLSANDALAAATWRARSWLGHPATLDDGAPADLVVLAEDPRKNLSVLEHPARVVLRGRVVA